MQLAIVAAGFSPGEADRLRRAMGAWKRSGASSTSRRSCWAAWPLAATAPNSRSGSTARCWDLASMDFPESHAASFALLVYDSSWLKHHEPAAFTCALLNSQPMGFYGPAQLVRDARAHGVEVRPVDVQASAYESLSSVARMQAAFAAGDAMVKSLSEAAGKRVEAARIERPLASVHDLARRQR